MIETLEKIFGSAAKVKIMRLFLFNPSDAFDTRQIIDRAKVTSSSARSELGNMQKIGLIKKKSFFRDFVTGSGKRKKVHRRRTLGWTLDESFEYLDSLQNLLIQVSPMRNGEIVKRLSRVGKLKLVIVSGAFIQNWDSRIDLLVVGDNMKKTALENIIKVIESEVGREIRYASFETSDFKYRLGVYDKLIRDVLDYPHETILDKIGIAVQ
jgi:hypothetical protein